MKIINCTPHDCHIYAYPDRPPILTLPHSGSLARVGETLARADYIEVDGVETTIRTRSLGAVSGLPPAEPDTLYLVSTMVADAATDRDDLVVPGEIVRDGNGRIIGCIGLYRPQRTWSRSPALAAAAAYRHVERNGHRCDGIVLVDDGRTFKGLRTGLIHDGTQSASAELLACRGVWRRDCRGPWLDGYGREVANEDIEPSAGWTRCREMMLAELGTLDGLTDWAHEPSATAEGKRVQL